jgi:predicted ArsR family transcriptional regulator
MVKAGVLSDTRIRILKLLLLEDSSPGLISNRLGIKEFAIRRHLDILEKEGLVAPSLRKTGDVGHPLKVYSLTKKGRKLEIFPNQQKKLLLLLIENIFKRYGREFVVSLFSDLAEDLSREFSIDIKGEDFESKCKELAIKLDNFGCCTLFRKEGECYAIYEYNCVFNEIAKIYGDLICNFMDKSIAKALGGNVLIIREFCMGRGDRMCKRLIKQLPI